MAESRRSRFLRVSRIRRRPDGAPVSTATQGRDGAESRPDPRSLRGDRDESERIVIPRQNRGSSERTDLEIELREV
jgi:hypothetical protein